MIVPRILEVQVRSDLLAGKSISIAGAPDIGKTTFVKTILESLPERSALWLNGDNPDNASALTETTPESLGVLIAGHNLVVIDEAHRVLDINATLAMLEEYFPHVQLLVISSVVHPAALNGGQVSKYVMYPLAFSELAQANGVDAEKSQLAQRLVFGSYPDVLHAPGKEVEVLQNIVKHYLYKDLFRTEQLKKPVLLENIVRAIALQMGKEISFHEIGQVIRASPQTVEKYVDLLEKACIVFRLPSLSRNLRTEIKKGRRIYFYDNGFRNAILNSFAPLETRSDISVLWENYLVSERLKMLKYTGSTTPGYFWRTTDQQTVDYIEEPPGELNVFAFKWNPETPAKIHDIFTQNYKITNLMAVSRGNYDVFLKV